MRDDSLRTPLCEERYVADATYAEGTYCRLSPNTFLLDTEGLLSLSCAKSRFSSS
jgi:hypothetical protein